MEPTEVIDLSSDDEKSPLKVKKEPVEIDKIDPPGDVMKNDTIKKNNNDDQELEVVYNVVRNQKRTIKSSGNACPTKKLKLSDDCKPLGHKVVKSELHSNDLFNSSGTNENEQPTNQSDETPQETSLPSCSSRPSVSGMTIVAYDKSSSHTKTGRKNLGDDKSRREDNKMSPSAGQRSRSIEDQQMSSSAGQRSRSVKANESFLPMVKVIRPQLIVKSRVKVLESKEIDLALIKEMFQSFLDICSKKDPSNDMMEILRRLKKRFNNLDPGFAKSESFMHTIRNKRDLISNNASDIYRHMLEVRDEMKARQVRCNPVIRYENENEDLIVLKTHERSEENCTLNEKAGTSKDPKENQQLRALEKAMRRCQRYINKCETAEVDFDDENDSHYILAEKYKYRMVELYNKYCEITGESPDAARPYLRPKNFTVTPLPLLNNAIASFINTKIMRMNKLGRTKQETRSISFAEALIFPDYVDILNCVEKCNNEQNLQLSKAKEREIAKQAFTNLGEHLQRCRKLDYYDTFSLFLEQGYHDPASEDENLAAKLRKNHDIGKKKLNEVFEEFVVKQNEIAEKGTASNAKQKSQDDRSGKSSHNTDSNPEESENEVPYSESDDDIVENENIVSSAQLQGDSKQDSEDDSQVVRHAKEKNTTETSGESSIQVSDEKISLTLVKTEEKKTNLNTNQTDGEESKENIEISIEKTKQKEITLPKNEFSRIPVKRIGGGAATKKYSGPGNNEKCVPLPIPIPIQKPASKPVTRKEIAIQPSEESDVILASNALPTIPANNNEVVVTPAISSTVKTTDDEDETKPILRPRSFAKASAFWEDIQIPTSDSIANTGTSGQVGRATVVKKLVEMSPEKLEQIKLSKLASSSPLRKTVQVKTDVSNDSKVKKITVMIPSNIVSGSNSTVNVQSVTSNITFVNVRNHSEFTPKITSVVSYKPKAPQTDEKSGKNESITFTQGNKRVMSGTFNEHPTSEKTNVVYVARDHNQHTSSVKKPTNQVTSNIGKAALVPPQRQYRILSPKNMSSQIQTTNIHNLPVKNRNGKSIVYKLMRNISTEPKRQKTNIPRTVPQSGTSRVQNQRPNSNSVPVADSEFEFQVSRGINKKSSHIKVPNSGTTNANKTRELSADGIPTYVIE